MKLAIRKCEKILQEALESSDLCCLWNSMLHITITPFIFLLNRDFSWSIEQIWGCSYKVHQHLKAQTCFCEFVQLLQPKQGCSLPEGYWEHLLLETSEKEKKKLRKMSYLKEILVFWGLLRSSSLWKTGISLKPHTNRAKPSYGKHLILIAFAVWDEDAISPINFWQVQLNCFHYSVTSIVHFK